MADPFPVPGRLDECPVELVVWPRDAQRRASLARAGVPRLLLVEPDAAPPVEVGLDEDWIRLPAGEAEILAVGRAVLQALAGLDHDRPFVDEHQVLHRGAATVPLRSREARLLTMLLQQRGTVVTVDDLAVAWGDATPSRYAVDAAISRLRRRLTGLNLVIRTVRGRGYVIDVDRAAAR